MHTSMQPVPGATSDYSGWEEVEFGTVATFALGRTPPRKRKECFAEAEGFPWVTISDMADQPVVVKTKECVTGIAVEDVFRHRIVPAGTLLMSIKLTIGRTSFMGQDGFHNEAIVSIQPDLNRVLSEYLFYLMPSIDYRQYQDRAIKGQTINSEKLRRIRLWLPPLDEQRRIVRLLDVISASASASLHCVDASKQLELSLMSQMFPKSIGAAPESLLGRHSEWTLSTIGEQMTLQRGFDITKKNQRPGHIPVVSSSGIKSLHDTAMAEGPGVIIGRKGSLGTAHYVETDYWPHDTTLWVTDFKSNSPKFVYYFLRQLDVSHLDVGASNPTLNRNHLYPTAVVWPDISSQQRMVGALDALNDRARAEGSSVAAVDELFVRTLAAVLGKPESSS